MAIFQSVAIVGLDSPRCDVAKSPSPVAQCGLAGGESRRFEDRLEALRIVETMSAEPARHFGKRHPIGRFRDPQADHHEWHVPAGQLMQAMDKETPSIELGGGLDLDLAVPKIDVLGLP